MTSTPQSEAPPPYIPPPSEAPRKEILPLSWSAPWDWLRLGWSDMRAYPGISGFAVCFLVDGVHPGRGVPFQTRIHHDHCLRLPAARAFPGHGSVRRQLPPGRGLFAHLGPVCKLLALPCAQHGHAGAGADRAGVAVGQGIAGGVCGVLQYRHAVDGQCHGGSVQPPKLGVRAGLYGGGRRF